MTDTIAIMILARAPIPGRAKTRLIPALGTEGAARLQERFIADAVSKAVAAQTGPVTLWCTPDIDFPIFQRSRARYGVALAVQPDADLGARMLAALSACHAPALTIGTDCPAMTPAHLRRCADSLLQGADAVFLPSEDGGYALVGMNRPHGRLFENMAWSTSSVMAETRKRLTELGWIWEEPAKLWDVDQPSDLLRLSRLPFGRDPDNLTIQTARVINRQANPLRSSPIPFTESRYLAYPNGLIARN